MSLEENFKEKQGDSIIEKIVTGAICIVAFTAATFILYCGLKYGTKCVCDYLNKQKIEQIIPKPY